MRRILVLGSSGLEAKLIAALAQQDARSLALLVVQQERAIKAAADWEASFKGLLKRVQVESAPMPTDTRRRRSKGERKGGRADRWR